MILPSLKRCRDMPAIPRFRRCANSLRSRFLMRAAATLRSGTKRPLGLTRLQPEGNSANGYSLVSPKGRFLTFRNEAAFGTNETVTIGGVPFRLLYPSRQFPSSLNAPEFSVRGDWKINDKNSFWYRQLYQKADNLNGLTSTASAGNIGDVPVNSKISSASFTTQISNTAVNEFRFIFNRLGVVFGGGCEGKFATCIPDPVSNMGQTLPNIAFTGLRSSITGRSLQGIGPATNL